MLAHLHFVMNFKTFIFDNMDPVVDTGFLGPDLRPSGEFLNYNVFVESLIARFGVKSDDGDLWTDKNSGWTIQRLEDTNEEEYDGGINRGPIANVQQPSLSVYNHKDKYPKMVSLILGQFLS